LVLSVGATTDKFEFLLSPVFVLGVGANADLGEADLKDLGLAIEAARGLAMLLGELAAVDVARLTPREMREALAP
jgi:hypothetical protein